MRIFGLEIKRYQPPRTEMRHIGSVDLDDWLKFQPGAMVSLSTVQDYEASNNGMVRVTLWCEYKGSEVRAAGVGDPLHTAFQTALADIEATVGTQWRSALPVTEAG